MPESANAAGDIASLTPQHTLLSTGGHTTVTTGHDTNLLAQRHQAWAVKGGISLFTRGEAKNPQRAVQDVGIKLHAASGNVRTESQSGPFTLTAQQGIDLQSTTAHIEITAPNRIVLNGGGGYVKIEGGNWAAAGLKDTLLRCEVKPEVVYGNEKAVQPRVQA